MPNFKTTEKDGFKITWLDDGYDYPALLDDFLHDRLEKEGLAHWPDRETHKIQAGGRVFVVKRCCPPPEKLKRHLWDLVSGFAFSRLMRETWAAKERGVDFIPDIYLAAEKVTGFNLCPDSYHIAEFIEGELYSGNPHRDIPPEWCESLQDTIGRLHAAGLASGSPHPGNLVKTPEGIKMFDLSFKGPMIVCQGHDAQDMKRKFNINARLDSRWLKIMVKMVGLKYWWHVWRRDLKAKLRARREADQ